MWYSAGEYHSVVPFMQPRLHFLCGTPVQDFTPISYTSQFFDVSCLFWPYFCNSQEPQVACCIAVFETFCKHLQPIHLKNVLPLVQNDNYSEPKLVCRQLFSNVYEDIKSVYTFFQFLSQQSLCTLFLFKSHPENCLCDFPHCLHT